MTHDLLSQVLSPSDVKLLDPTQLDALCAQIRETLVEYGKRYGGHIGSNLGLVEACVALHVVFESPLDKIVFDVSHQSYVHKMLTGRAEAFRRAELFGTVTGFTNPGKASTTISCSGTPARRSRWHAAWRRNVTWYGLRGARRRRTM